MKVAIVTAFPADPARPCGGVEAVSVNLIRALARRAGTEVHVLTTDRESAAVPSRPLGERVPGGPVRGSLNGWEIASWQGATIHRLSAPCSSLLRYAVGDGRRQVHEYLKRLGPDVVHAHDTYGLMVKGLALPRVLTVHGFIHKDTKYQRGRLAWLRSLLWRWHETRSWADQAHIISISPFVRERLRSIVSGQIHDIENPIAEEFFDVHASGGSGTIFCAAAIRRLKNILGLVQAFEILLRMMPHVRLRLAGGESEPEYANEVRQYIASHGLTDRVDLLGSISAARVREELARADVFALVSFQENAPMGIAEALAAGVPVVTSNRCGMPFMVRHGETGFLVEPEHPEDIAARLAQLLQDAKLRRTQGTLARTAARIRFHPDSVAEKTRQVYACAESNGTPSTIS